MGNEIRDHEIRGGNVHARPARAFSLAILAVLVAGAACGPALAARHKSAAKTDAKTDAKTGAKPLDIAQPDKPAANTSTPQPLGQFGDWQAFQVGAGKTRSCFAISNPKDRQPAGLNRDPATLFITHRPSEGVHNEISVIAGFTMKDGADATLKLGSAAYALYTKEANAWVKNAAEEGTILATMKKSRDVTFVGTSTRGRTTTDSYSLNGFRPAVDAISKACP